MATCEASFDHFRVKYSLVYNPKLADLAPCLPEACEKFDAQRVQVPGW